MLNRKSNKLLLIELNEFNRELLCKAADAFQFKNIQRLNSLAESQTYTSDTLDSGYLEPWVQWVSLHSGIPSSEHRIKHLGDIASLKGKQIWEVWSDRGISSGVWGVLNGKRADAKLCEFFAPDPWTFSEPGYPESVTNYVALPRYLAKNRLNISWFMVMRHLFSFIKFFTTLKAIFGLLRELPQFLTNLLRFKGAVFVGYSLAE
ncbi:MAG: hypothetical protein NTV34_14130, partial [Proteobacteria bacterium]|nr:hypothetical protein [Pseudomonadota bacterium]